MGLATRLFSAQHAHPRRLVLVFAVCLLQIHFAEALEGATDDSVVKFWGENEHGQGGVEPQTWIEAPVDLFPSLNLSLVSQLGCGVYTTMVTLNNGTVLGIGFNTYEELTGYLPKPVVPELSVIPFLPQATHAASHAIFGLAHNSDSGKAWMWGWNYEGMLGLGISNISVSYPIEIPNYSSYNQLYSFAYYTFATILEFDSTGNARNRLALAWGYNLHGALGISGTNGTTISTPTTHPQSIYVSTVTGGWAHSIILDDEGHVLSAGHPCCIGRNATDTDSFRPVPLPSELKFKIARTSDRFTILMTTDNRVFVFGFFTDDYTDDRAQFPVEIEFGSVLDPGDLIIDVFAVHTRAFALSQYGHVYHWGNITAASSSSSTSSPMIVLEPTKFQPLESFFVTSFIFQDPKTRSSSDCISICALMRPKMTDCVGNPPSPAYTCLAGIWTARNSIVTIPTVTITTTVTISGSLSTESITFNGLGSSINVQDCFSATNIEINLEKSNDDTSTPTGSRIAIISQNTSCGNTLAGSTLTVKTTGSSCRKTTGRLEEENGSDGRTTYSVVFKVDSIRCSLWWIILVAVLGGIVLLVFVFIMMATFVKPVKAIVRPFWLRDNAPPSGK